MFKHILVPTDGTALSAHAVKRAARLARGWKAKLTAVHSFPPFRPIAYMDGYVAAPELFSEKEYERVMRGSARKMLDKAAAVAKAQGVKCAGVVAEADTPWAAILRTQRREGCDVIVMASHGRHGIDRLLLGSETSKVLAHAKVPVMVCR